MTNRLRPQCFFSFTHCCEQFPFSTVRSCERCSNIQPLFVLLEVRPLYLCLRPLAALNQGRSFWELTLSTETRIQRNSMLSLFDLVHTSRARKTRQWQIVCLASRKGRSAECERERTCIMATLELPQGIGECTPAVYCPVESSLYKQSRSHESTCSCFRMLFVLLWYPHSSVTRNTFKWRARSNKSQFVIVWFQLIFQPWKTVARHVTNVLLPIISKFAGIFPRNGDSTSQLDVCSWLVLLWLTGPHKLPQLWARIKPPVGTLTYINTCGCTPSLDLHLDVCWYHTKQNSSSFTGSSVSDECMLIWVPMPRDTQSRPGSCLQRRNKRLYSTVLLLIFMHNRCESSFRSATLYGRFVANNKQKWV